MAGAPRKQGLEYFPMSTYDSIPFKAIRHKYKTMGVAIYLELYKSIYGEGGYYLQWDEKQLKMFCLENDFAATKVKMIIADLLKDQVFDLNLFENFKILTNSEIQHVFFHAAKRRKELIYEPKYILISVDEYIKTGKVNDVEKIDNQEVKINGTLNDNHINVNINANIDEDIGANIDVDKTQTKERIGKDSKVEERIVKNIFNLKSEFEKNSDFKFSKSENLKIENQETKNFSSDLKVEKLPENEIVRLKINQEPCESTTISGNSLPMFGRRLTLNTPEKPKKLYSRVLEAYAEFMQHIIGLPMRKLKGGDGDATKEIIEYLKKLNPDEDEVVNNWILILCRWRELEPFFQKQFKLPQINSNLQRLMDDLSVGVNKTIIQNNGTGKGNGAKTNGTKPVLQEVREIFKQYRSNR